MEKILILGGTNFIGRNLIETLLQLDNFDITIFNRGKSNPNLYHEIRKIYGDRNTPEIDSIFNRNWDYIIDLSCYFPHSLSTITKQLNNTLKRYIFISTCSVYNNDLNKSILRDENSPTLVCSDDEKTDTSLTTYGKRKAECERILQQSGLRYSILRPSLVYGQYDNTDRLYYWLYQIKRGHDVLIPNRGERLFSVTYVKDLVKAIIGTLTEELESDIYNVTTYPKLSISKLISTIVGIAGNQPKTYAADSGFLKSHNISEWTDLPLWLDCDYFTYDNTKANRGLNIEFTEFDVSIKETFDYYNNLEWKEPIYGISEMVKMELINKLIKSNNS